MININDRISSNLSYLIGRIEARLDYLDSLLKQDNLEETKIQVKLLKNKIDLAWENRSMRQEDFVSFLNKIE